MFLGITFIFFLLSLFNVVDMEGTFIISIYAYMAIAVGAFSLFYTVYWLYTHFIRYKGRAYNENDSLF